MSQQQHNQRRSMTPQQAFIQDILANPQDDAVRQIYADWLEDRGEPKEAAKYRELPGTAALWCSGWGRDEYGLWCELAIGEVSQFLRWIPPGIFQMGSPEGEEGREENEGPRHRVEISRGFWMFDTPCTQKLWQAVMGSNPSHFIGPKRPVEQVRWGDCQEFIAKVNSQVHGLTLQLPTEAQWEYACRAGTEGPRYYPLLDWIAWYEDISAGQTHPVKEKEPNGFGLYDMLGNVWEWCHDGLRDYSEESLLDPVGPTEAHADRAIRGGGWAGDELDARAAARDAEHTDNRYQSLGFRCLS